MYLKSMFALQAAPCKCMDVCKKGMASVEVSEGNEKRKLQLQARQLARV